MTARCFYTARKPGLIGFLLICLLFFATVQHAKADFFEPGSWVTAASESRETPLFNTMDDAQNAKPSKATLVFGNVCQVLATDQGFVKLLCGHREFWADPADLTEGEG